MNIHNTKTIVGMIVDLSSVRNVVISSSTIEEIDNRILELAKALKFEEEDLERFLNGQPN